MKPDATRPGPYPVALIPGQFQNYYKKFTPEELNRLPLGTVMNTDHLYPPQRDASPPPLTIAEVDLSRQQREEAMRAREAAVSTHIMQIKQVISVGKFQIFQLDNPHEFTLVLHFHLLRFPLFIWFFADFRSTIRPTRRIIRPSNTLETLINPKKIYLVM